MLMHAILILIFCFAAQAPPAPQPKEATPADRTEKPPAKKTDGESFVAKPQPATPPPPAPALTSEEQSRYDQVAVALVKAMNAEDKVAYRALHTDQAWAEAIDWWRDMFAVQRAKFGPIVRAYPCTRETLRFGKLGFRGEGTTFVGIFEESVGGAFSFELNAEGKITRTSVFIKEEMANYEAGEAKPIYERK